MKYPETSNDLYNEWSQRCNPVIQTCTQDNTDFNLIHEGLPSIGSGGFGGLLTSGISETFLDGNPSNYWYYAIGAAANTPVNTNTFPGAGVSSSMGNFMEANVVELYVLFSNVTREFQSYLSMFSSVFENMNRAYQFECDTVSMYIYGLS